MANNWLWGSQIAVKIKKKTKQKHFPDPQASIFSYIHGGVQLKKMEYPNNLVVITSQLTLSF